MTQTLTLNSEQPVKINITAQLTKVYSEDFYMSAGVVMRTCMCVLKVRAKFMSLFLLSGLLSVI